MATFMIFFPLKPSMYSKEGKLDKWPKFSGPGLTGLNPSAEEESRGAVNLGLSGVIFTVFPLVGTIFAHCRTSWPYPGVLSI